MHTFFSELVRKLKLNSVAGDVGSFNPVAELILMQIFLENAVQMGLKQEAIQLMAQKLKDATWRIWEYA